MINKHYFSCHLCPRNCGINRYNNTGACHTGAVLSVARSALHPWEELVLSGTKGSGTVFFTGCSLGCIYCQNHEISGIDKNFAGSTFISETDADNFFTSDISKLSDSFLLLQEAGAANINLVTGAHFVPHIISALDKARNEGLILPVVYNSSGYENVDTLKMLDGYVDIYLPDFKYIDPQKSLKYSNAANYPEIAKAAIDEMVRQQPNLIFQTNCSKMLLLKGVIIRHLVLPLNTKSSIAILDYLYEKYGDSVYFSIMSQYTPVKDFPDSLSELNRKITSREYNKVLNHILKLNIQNCFIQEGEAASESFIPDWNGGYGFK